MFSPYNAEPHPKIGSQPDERHIVCFAGCRLFLLNFLLAKSKTEYYQMLAGSHMNIPVSSKKKV